MSKGYFGATIALAVMTLVEATLVVFGIKSGFVVPGPEANIFFFFPAAAALLVALTGSLRAAVLRRRAQQRPGRQRFGAPINGQFRPPAVQPRP